jgi:hypothetical protein
MTRAACKNKHELLLWKTGSRKQTRNTGSEQVAIGDQHTDSSSRKEEADSIMLGALYHEGCLHDFFFVTEVKTGNERSVKILILRWRKLGKYNCACIFFINSSLYF